VAVERDDPAVEDGLPTHCVVCGTALTDAEIEAAHDGEHAFACSTHAAELAPAEELAREDVGGPAPP
jgi:hypothetical protein